MSLRARLHWHWLGCWITAWLTTSFCQTSAARAEIGPQWGSLVIVGGGLKDGAILQRFIDLAGGPDAPIVVIPTAGEEEVFDARYWPGLKQLREAGARKLIVLHTRDRKLSDSDAFVEPIRSARGVWFTGGRQWRLADAYLNTRTHRELQELLGRGGVVGGTSAGATILGSFLVRGDTSGNTILVGDHQEGFGLLRNVAIDQHLLARNRQFDLIEVVEKHPHLLGIGLDEDTALVVMGDVAEVVGRSYVAIYDSTKVTARDGRFYVLGPGDRFDLKKREATPAARDSEALAPVRARRGLAGARQER